MGKSYMTGWSASLIIRKAQTQTTMNYRLTPIRMAIYEKDEIRNVGED